MSDRYTRLFTLPANLYAEGAPLLIVAGALLKDNQTGKLIAQLKFHSVSEKDILAVKVKIVPFDTAEKPLDTEVTYQYLDLCAARDEDFGAKTPVFLPDSAARSYTAAVSEVIFTDKTFWQSAGQPWETLSAPEPLEGALEDAETLKQYQMQYGADCRYKPLWQKDLWYCACGALNRQEDALCHHCNREFVALDSTLVHTLETQRDERLAEDRRQAEVERVEQAHQAELARESAKKTKKIAMIVVPILCVVAAFLVLLSTVIIPNGKYNEATALAEAGNTAQAAIAFGSLDYKDSAERSMALWDRIAVRNTIAANQGTIAVVNEDGTVSARGWNNCGECDVLDWANIVAVATGPNHTVGLKADGTVAATGSTDSGACDVSDWTDIVTVTAGFSWTIGLKADGTVIATGWNGSGQCDVSGWTDIVAVAAGANQTVGLKINGSVVATGYNKDGACDVSDWTDIVAVAVGSNHTIGLKADGTVVATGSNDNGECDVSDWTDIVAVAAGGSHTVGLKTDGTVIATGCNDDGECNVSDWTDIVTIAAGDYATFGLKSDGTAVQAGDMHETSGWPKATISGWTNIKLPK